VSDDVGDARRGKIKEKRLRKGETPSIKLLKLADWTVICTNIPSELLSLDEGLILMRTRWHIDKCRSEKQWRILCELYAKLIVVIIQHWILLTGWKYPDRSLFKSIKTIRKHAMDLARAFATGIKEKLLEALETIARCLSCGCRINKRKTILHTYQLLLGVS
jgi:hypothetical protein